MGHYSPANKEHVRKLREYMVALHDQVLNLVRQGQHWDQRYRNVKYKDEYKPWFGYEHMRVPNILGWCLGFTTGAARRPRERQLPAGEVHTVLVEIGRATQRFGLPEQTRVVSYYEAGRDGFWLHRFLVAQGVGLIPHQRTGSRVIVTFGAT